MIGVVIVAHGNLAQEYLRTLEHILGPQTGIIAVSIKDDHDRAAKEAEIIDLARSVDQGDGVVIVTDLFGASPCNLSLHAGCGGGRAMLYGANLPLLVRLAKSRHLDLHTAATRAAEAGRKYIDIYSTPRPSPT